MATDLIANLSSDPQRRRDVARAVEEYVTRTNPTGDELSNLRQIRDALLVEGNSFIALDETLTELLGRIAGASALPLSASAARFSDTAPALDLYVPFIQRRAGDTLRTFIDDNLDSFGLGTGVSPAERRELVQNFFEKTGIRLGTAKRWGTPRENNEFVEPADLDQVLAVFTWLDNQARKNGARVDIIDYFASIYPQIASMIERANGNEIVIRVPKFMEGISFDEYSYSSFAQAAQRARLVPEMAEATKGGHIRGEVERPRFETLDRYATLISQKAEGDDAHRRQIFDFLVVLRLLSIFKNTVPIRDEAGRLLTTPNPQVASAYSIRVVPENELTEYLSFDGTARFSTQRWPFSDIASGRMDRMFDILERRLTAMKLLSSVIETDEAQMRKFEQRLGEFTFQHEIHKANIQDRNAPAEVRTLEYLNEVKEFYRRFNLFFGQKLFYTHVRGTVQQGNITAAFEIVPKINGIPINSLAHGRVTVFTDDLIETANREDWPEGELETAFKLRVITNRMIASGAADRRILDSAQSILNAVAGLNLGIDAGLLSKAADALVALNKKPDGEDAVETSLYSFLRLRTTGTQPSSRYYLYSETPWQARMAEYYQSQGYSPDTLEIDTAITESYLVSVRHPLFVYSESKLESEISKLYDNAQDVSAARERMIGFFKTIGVRTAPVERHPLTPEETGPDLKAIEWAFRDYLELFPGARVLGAQIEINEALLVEVVDRQIAEHPNAGLRRGFIMRGVKKAIEDFNRGRTREIGEIAAENYPLPTGGLLDKRFNAFVSSWEARTGVRLDRTALLVTYNILKDNGLSPDAIENNLRNAGVSELDLDDHIEFMTDWLPRSRAYRSAFEPVITAGDVTQFLQKKENEQYNSPFVSAEDIASIALEYVKQRLASPPQINVDVDSIIASQIGHSFDPYPSIKAQAVPFYRMMVGLYLKDLYPRVKELRELAVAAIEDAAETFSDFDYVGGGYADLEKSVLTTLGFSNAEDLQRLDLQVTLLSEILGTPEPYARLMDKMNRAYNRYDARMHAAAVENERREHAISLAEGTLQNFIGDVERFTFQYSAPIFVDGMDRGSIATARAKIKKGLRTASGLTEQFKDSVNSEWNEFRTLAPIVGKEDHFTEILNVVPDTIGALEAKLKEEEELLDIRLEEIGNDEKQEAINSDAMQTISQADKLKDRISAFESTVAGAASNIDNFRTTNINAALRSPPATENFDSYNLTLANLTSFSQHIDGYRQQIESLQKKLDELTADPVAAQLHVSEEIATGDAGTRTHKAMEDFKQAMAAARTAIEDARSKLSAAETALHDLELKLQNDEALITPPSSVTMPQRTSIANTELVRQGGVVISFNMGTPAANLASKISRFQQELAGLRVLAIGDNSYIVGANTASQAAEWISSSRQQPFRGRDFFGAEIVIAAGTRGVRVSTVNSLTNPGHPLVTFRNKLLFAVENAASYETDFVIKLHNAAGRNNPAAVAMWTTFITALSGADIASGADCRRFIRCFALSHRDDIRNIDSLSRAAQSWFKERRELFFVAMSPDEEAELREHSVDYLAGQFAKMRVSEDVETNQIGMGEFSLALKSFLGSAAQNWWNENLEKMPIAFGIVWQMTTTVHGGAELRHALLAGFANFIEAKRPEGGGPIVMEPAETLKFMTRFLLENMIDLRYGDILYDNDRRLYSPKTQARLAEIYRRRHEHPEFVSVKIDDNHYDVTKEELGRLAEIMSQSGARTVILTHYDWDTQQFTKTTLNIEQSQLLRQNIENDPAVKHTSFLYQIYNNPRLLGLGYMIGAIFYESKGEMYRALVELLDATDKPDHEFTSDEIVKFEDAVEKIYRENENIELTTVFRQISDIARNAGRPASTVTGLYEPEEEAMTQSVKRLAELVDLSIATFLGGAWNIFPSDERTAFTMALARLAVAMQNKRVSNSAGEHFDRAMGVSQQQGHFSMRLNTGYINQFFRSSQSRVHILRNTIPIRIPLQMIPVLR